MKTGQRGRENKADDTLKLDLVSMYHQLYFLSPFVLFSCIPFGTKSYIYIYILVCFSFNFYAVQN